MPDNTLTGARLVEAGALAAKREHYLNPKLEIGPDPFWRERELAGARAALRAQAEAARVDAEMLEGCGNILRDLSSDLAPVAAYLRAMAEVLRDE